MHCQKSTNLVPKHTSDNVTREGGSSWSQSQAQLPVDVHSWRPGLGLLFQPEARWAIDKDFISYFSSCAVCCPCISPQHFSVYRMCGQWDHSCVPGWWWIVNAILSEVTMLQFFCHSTDSCFIPPSIWFGTIQQLTGNITQHTEATHMKS